MLSRFAHNWSCFLAIVFFATVGVAAQAAEPMKGVKVNVIAEYPSKVGGLEIVRMVLVSIEPGGGFNNIPIKSEEYCELAKGTLTRTDHDTGVTNYITVGARWAPTKGHKHTVVNTSNVIAEMWVYQLIESGESKAGGMK